MIPYIFHTSILLAACFIFYWIFIKKETFFQLNRWVLLASIILSTLIPFLTIPASWSLHDEAIAAQFVKTDSYFLPFEKRIRENTELSSTSSSGETTDQNAAIIPAQTSTSLSFSTILRYVYFIGLGVFLLSFLIQLFLLVAKTVILESVKDGKYKIVELTKDEAPFSFWNAIFINPNKYDLATYQQIIAHEKIHIQQVHFFDKLLVELVLIVFWFNPFVWLLRTAVTNNLEFLTDHSMLQQGVEKKSYQLSLLKVSVPQHPLILSTNYNQSFLKNRIAMMNAKKSSAQSIWKYLFILPLLVLSIVSLNAVHTDTTDTSKDSSKILDKLTDDKVVKKEIDQQSELAKLKVELLSDLLKDNLIQSKREDVLLQFQASAVLLNGIALQATLANKYVKLLESYKIEACPCDHVFITEDYIRIGNMTDQGFQGSIHGNYDIDHDEHLDFPEMEEHDEEEHEQEHEQEHEEQEEYEHHHDDEDNNGDHYRDNERYLEESEKELNDLAYLNHMRLEQPSNPNWNWPEFQAALIHQLKKDKLIEGEHKFKIELANDYIKVNRTIVMDNRHQQYLALFKKYDKSYGDEWCFYKNGANILVLGPLQDVALFKKELLSLLSSKRLIQSSTQKIKLEIPGHQLILNGKVLDQSHIASVHQLLKKHGVQAAPGKKIEINLPDASIMVGYKTGDRSHTGTWLSY